MSGPRVGATRAIPSAASLKTFVSPDPGHEVITALPAFRWQ
jgi:hypothetical protein